MNYKICYVLFFMLALVLQGKAQDHDWAFGFYGDVQMKSPYPGAFGIQGKYDFLTRSAVQAQVYGKSGYVAVGADYLVSFLDKTKSNFNVFLGGGISQDFYRYNELWSGDAESIPTERENFTILNGQAGISYYFPAVNVSVYTGYKLKYNIDWEETAPDYIMFGVRYHLW